MINTEFAELLSSIDGDLIDRADKAAVCKKKTNNMIGARWVAIAACFAAAMLVCVPFVGSRITGESEETRKPVFNSIEECEETRDPVFNVIEECDTVKPTVGSSQMIVTDDLSMPGIYIDGKIYKPILELSGEATEKNVGDMIGEVSFNVSFGKTVSGIPAYKYLPDDGKTDMLIFKYGDRYCVCSFYSHAKD